MRAAHVVVAALLLANASALSARPPPPPRRGKSKGRKAREKANRRDEGRDAGAVAGDDGISAREARLSAKFAGWTSRPEEREPARRPRGCLWMIALGARARVRRSSTSYERRVWLAVDVTATPRIVLGWREVVRLLSWTSAMPRIVLG